MVTKHKCSRHYSSLPALLRSPHTTLTATHLNPSYLSSCQACTKLFDTLTSSICSKCQAQTEYQMSSSKKCHILTPCLLVCLQATIRLHYFPKSWRTWTTIV